MEDSPRSLSDGGQSSQFPDIDQIGEINIPSITDDDDEIDVINTENEPSGKQWLGAANQLTCREVDSPKPGPSGINQYESENEDVQVDSDDSIEIIHIPKKPVPVIVLSDTSSDSEVDVIEIGAKKHKKEQKKVPKTIKEKLEEHKGKIFAVKKETVEGEHSPPNKHDITCSICLGIYDNRAFLDECFHSFCYMCILQWAKVVQTCPLCKSPFKSIIYDIQPDLQYKQDFLNKQTNTSSSSAEPLSSGFFDSWMETGPRFRYRTTFTSLGNYINDWYRQRRYDLSRYGMPRNDRRRERGSRWGHRQSAFSSVIASEERRRSVYRCGMVIQEIRHPPGRVRYRDISVQFFKENPAIAHRLVPWILRDLKIILDNNSSDTSFVLHLIMSLLQRYPMESDEFYNQLQPYLFNNTRQFIRELISFASSPYDMRTYDSRVVYDMPSALQSATSASASHPTTISQSATGGDSSDSTSIRDRLLDELFDENANDVSPPLRSSNSPVPGGSLENQGWSSGDSIIDVTEPDARRKSFAGKGKATRRGDIVYVGRPKENTVSAGHHLRNQSGHHIFFTSGSSDEDAQSRNDARITRVNLDRLTSATSAKKGDVTTNPSCERERSLSALRQRNSRLHHTSKQSDLELSPEFGLKTSSAYRNRLKSKDFSSRSSRSRRSRSREAEKKSEDRTSVSRSKTKAHRDSHACERSSSTSIEYRRRAASSRSKSKERKKHRSRHSRPGSIEDERSTSKSRLKDRKSKYKARSSRSRSRESRDSRLKESKSHRRSYIQDSDNRLTGSSDGRLESESRSGSKETIEKYRSRRSRSRSRQSNKSSKDSNWRVSRKKYRSRSRSMESKQSENRVSKYLDGSPSRSKLKDSRSRSDRKKHSRRLSRSRESSNPSTSMDYHKKNLDEGFIVVASSHDKPPQSSLSSTRIDGDVRKETERGLEPDDRGISKKCEHGKRVERDIEEDFETFAKKQTVTCKEKAIIDKFDERTTSSDPPALETVNILSRSHKSKVNGKHSNEFGDALDLSRTNLDEKDNNKSPEYKLKKQNAPIRPKIVKIRRNKFTQRPKSPENCTKQRDENIVGSSCLELEERMGIDRDRKVEGQQEKDGVFGNKTFQCYNDGDVLNTEVLSRANGMEPGRCEASKQNGDACRLNTSSQAAILSPAMDVSRYKNLMPTSNCFTLEQVSKVEERSLRDEEGLSGAKEWGSDVAGRGAGDGERISSVGRRGSIEDERDVLEQSSEETVQRRTSIQSSYDSNERTSSLHDNSVISSTLVLDCIRRTDSDDAIIVSGTVSDSMERAASLDDSEIEASIRELDMKISQNKKLLSNM